MVFKPIETLEFPHQVIACIEGFEDTRKTSFSLTAPGPIGFINFDRGLARARRPEGKDIKVASFPFRRQEGQDVAQKLLSAAERDIHGSLDEHATTVIDTGDLLWECIRLAHHGQLEKVRERYYGEVNRVMNDIFDHALDSGNHLLVIHPLTEVFKGDKGTGKFGPKGWKNTTYRVNHRIRLEHEDGIYLAQILKPRGVSDAIENPTFQDIAMALYPESDEDEWD